MPSMLSRPSWRALVLTASCALLSPPSWADRPFLMTETAVAEDDDEEVWSIDTWATGASGLFSLEASVEYAINPYNAVSFGAGWGRAKEDGLKAYERELELEYQHILIDIARDGFGLGIGLGASFEREDGWEHAATELTVPLSWRNDDGTLRLHLSPGWVKPKEGKGYGQVGLGFEKDFDRNVLVAELGTDSADEKSTLLQAGVRHWIKRGKMAIDVTVGRLKFETEGRTFVTVGLSLFDLK